MRWNNFTIYTIASSVMYLAWGLVGPFYYIYVNRFGGSSIEQFGISLGILEFAAAIFSFLSGRFSDKLGRKPFLIMTSLFYAVLVYSYTIINSVVQLYILQAFFGAIFAIEETVNASFLGDITKKSKRGFQVGVFKSIVYLFSGIAIIMGGFLIKRVGFEIIFYLGSALIAFGTIPMLWIKETVRKRKVRN